MDSTGKGGTGKQNHLRRVTHVFNIQLLETDAFTCFSHEVVTAVVLGT